MYRKIGNSLFKFYPEYNSYICVYTRSGYTKQQLIAAYEASDD